MGWSHVLIKLQVFIPLSTASIIDFEQVNVYGMKTQLKNQLTFTHLMSTIKTLAKGVNMFKINNKNIRTMSMMLFCCFCC